MQEYRPINLLQEGESVDQIWLVAEATPRMTRPNHKRPNGSPYVQLTLKDRTGRITANVWNWDLNKNPINTGDYVKITASCKAYQGRMSIATESRIYQYVPTHRQTSMIIL